MSANSAKNKTQQDKWNEFVSLLIKYAGLPSTCLVRLAFINPQQQNLEINNYDDLKTLSKQYGIKTDKTHIKMNIIIQVLALTFDQYQKRFKYEQDLFTKNNALSNEFILSPIITINAVIQKPIKIPKLERHHEEQKQMQSEREKKEIHQPPKQASFEELRYKHYYDKKIWKNTHNKNKLIISNWPMVMNKEILSVLFSPYGNIINYGVTEQFAFIQYESEQSSQRAIDALDGFQIGMNILSVQYTKIEPEAEIKSEGNKQKDKEEGNRKLVIGNWPQTSTLNKRHLSCNEEMKEQYENNENVIQIMNEKMNKLKDKNSKLTQQNNKLQQENNTYLNRANNLNEQNHALYEEIENFKNKHNELLRTVTEKQEEKVVCIKDNYQRKLDKQKAKIVTLQHELSQQTEKMSNVKSKLLQQTQNTADNEQLQQQIDDVSIRNTKLKKESDEMKDAYMKRIDELELMNDEYRQEIAIFNSQDQDDIIVSLQLQIEKVKQKNDNNLLQYEEDIKSLSAENEQLKKQLEKKQMKEETYHFNPCDDEEDDIGIYVHDDKKKDDLNNYQVPDDDELCQTLQDDLETYMCDQKKRRKHPLKELRIFHEKKSQIIRNWDIMLYKNYLKSVWEKLVDKIEDKYDDEDNDIDADRLVYNILFDVVIECYDVLHTEHNKIYQHEYMSPKVIDMVWMNIDNFYALMKRNKLKNRITNIYKYIHNMINEIYKRVQNKHAHNMNDLDMEELFKFMVNCCEIIWSVLHYDFTISPLNFLLHPSDTKYDPMMHENDGDCRGNNIEYYVFPAMMKDNKYQTKIWVICDDIE